MAQASRRSRRSGPWNGSTSRGRHAIKYLWGIPSLQRLSLARTRVGDDALVTIAAFSGLRELDLSATGITDLGLATLAPLARLNHLRLSDLSLTNAVIPHLAKHESLWLVDLTGTAVSREGRGLLRKTLPLCRVLPDDDEERSFAVVSLEEIGNHELTEQLYSLQTLGAGPVKSADISFLIGEKLIRLGSTVRAEDPERVTVPLSTTARRLHFLHSEHYQDGVAVLAFYVVHYKDGRQAVIPVIKGQNIRDYEVADPAQIPRSIAVGWIGPPNRPDRTEIKPALYRLSWDNPFPDVPIDRIELTSRKQKTSQATFIVAISAEK